MRTWFGPLATYLIYAAVACAIFHRALECQNETRRLCRERRQLQSEIARLRAQNLYREQVRTALQSDAFYVERVLRERYGYHRTDEELPGAPPARLVQRVRPDGGPSPSRAPALARMRLDRTRSRR